VIEPSKRAPFQPPRKLLVAVDMDDDIDPTTRGWVTLDEDGNMVFLEASEQRQSRTRRALRGLAPQQTHDQAPAKKRWLRMVGSKLRANADQFWGEGEFTARPLLNSRPSAFTTGWQVPRGAPRIWRQQDRLNAHHELDSLNEHRCSSEPLNPATTASEAGPSQQARLSLKEPKSPHAPDP
jgi:type I restriction enzyme R subunit